MNPLPGWSRGFESKAAQLQKLLTTESAEFRAVWDKHEIGIKPREVKRYNHPEVGRLELSCQLPAVVANQLSPGVGGS
ncbi:hypothetical protein [Mycolicibacterium duvalii]|uniref:MmyB-like transcription regulator ligand binding domain-containing protein n=1 Tax=Mycolicibacterium duvalii TaxID=39688 RepID=A0A7I7K5R6_9MYCO|nr:hypothetical protein [Mycolicibacterium duvalii]MCV7365872.1 hypothetical protein [Mycolicibacterium duvalii]BBX19373.1 hypothetical protein MDUV_42330 [Mycolicibacterium duvalii]